MRFVIPAPYLKVTAKKCRISYILLLNFYIDIKNREYQVNWLKKSYISREITEKQYIDQLSEYIDFPSPIQVIAVSKCQIEVRSRRKNRH